MVIVCCIGGTKVKIKPSLKNPKSEHLSQTSVMKKSVAFLFLLAFNACSDLPSAKELERIKKEVIETELAFTRMAADSRIEAAFLHYAAKDAVLKRGNKLIAGFDSISAYLVENKQAGAELTWYPDFSDVAASGDLAYTYGKFVYSFPDSTGTIRKQEGIFHTVWKRQTDGKWKFVWD
ncbi:MAG: hypothetical protein CVU14_01005 [Bacteroidetes bacterium HGW-Bacteroidetes-9]|nr:MAG: hypothetical protein CVU14_01005 [Bacteroidetes bacterium HGW-Bacteroidetes-9]